MDLLKHPEKLEEILELFIEHLQQQGMLPNKMNSNEMIQLKQQVLDLLLKSDALTFSDQGLKFNPNDPLAEQEGPLGMMNMLFLMTTVECLKKYDFKPLFGEKSDDPKEQALIEKLVDALRKLKEAKNPNDAEAAFDEVMKLCDELSNKAGLKPSLKIQVEMVRMIANQMKNEVNMQHDSDYLPKPHPQSQTKPEEDLFTTYLRNLYGGVDPRFGGSVAVVTVAVSNDFGYGSSNAGDSNDMSQVAEGNRFDFKSDGTGRESIILQKLMGLGGSLLEVLHESRLLTPTPTNTPEN